MIDSSICSIPATFSEMIFFQLFLIIVFRITQWAGALNWSDKKHKKPVEKSKYYLNEPKRRPRGTKQNVEFNSKVS